MAADKIPTVTFVNGYNLNELSCKSVGTKSQNRMIPDNNRWRSPCNESWTYKRSPLTHRPKSLYLAQKSRQSKVPSKLPGRLKWQILDFWRRRRPEPRVWYLCPQSWLDAISRRNITHLRAANKQPLNLEGVQILYVNTDNIEIQVCFDVRNELALNVLVGASLIDCLVSGSFFSWRKIPDNTLQLEACLHHRPEEKEQ